MEKRTVLARIRVAIRFTQEADYWLSQNYQGSWFARNGGNAYLSEFGGRWSESITVITNREFDAYFSHIGVPDQYRPKVEIIETYSGSWIADAALTISATVGTTFAIFKGISEIPKIAEGITELKSSLQKKLEKTLNSDITNHLTILALEQPDNSVENRQTALQSAPPTLPTPPLPAPMVSVDFTIDARPMLALTPDNFLAHKIHLSVGISRSTFTLENLGDDPLNDVKIGLFKSASQRNKWSYGDSYTGYFPLVAGHQTVAKILDEFKDLYGNDFDISDGVPVHVDCWVQDSHGIYLFHFYLDKK